MDNSKNMEPGIRVQSPRNMEPGPIIKGMPFWTFFALTTLIRESPEQGNREETDP